MKKHFALLLCVLFLFTLSPIPAAAQYRDTSYEETLAQSLKSLGLFRGVSDTDFALDRAPTRVEALVMLIRVLGVESEAVNGSWRHPFTDVPAWADPYIGYAYENGLTNGVSATEFGTGNAGAAMYLTFVLRALGYSDALGDFSWDDPYDLAFCLDLLSGVDLSDFLRADVVLVSYASLSAGIKDTPLTLADSLIAKGVFSRNEYDALFGTPVLTEETLSFTEKQKILSSIDDAVVKVYNYDADGETLLSQGTGFFFDIMGNFITNAHVLEGTYYTKIKTQYGLEYEVDEIYRYNDTDSDYAVCHADCVPLDTVSFSDSYYPGEAVLAVGYPDDSFLQQTSEGIVLGSTSFEGKQYIENTAPTDHGSSGGVLVNRNGEVIGITTVGFDTGTYGAVPYSAFREDMKWVYVGETPLEFFHDIEEVSINSWNFEDYFDVYILDSLSAGLLTQVDYRVTVKLKDEYAYRKVSLDSFLSPKITVNINTKYRYITSFSNFEQSMTASGWCYLGADSIDELRQGVSGETSVTLTMALNNTLTGYETEYSVSPSMFSLNICD